MYHLEKPDVVAVDVAIPRIDGLRLIERLREMDPGVRVIVCTAEASRDIVTQAFRCGALDYVLRPFKPERMNTALERATCGIKHRLTAC